jgi:hypothetical protein
MARASTRPTQLGSDKGPSGVLLRAQLRFPACNESNIQTLRQRFRVGPASARANLERTKKTVPRQKVVGASFETNLAHFEMIAIVSIRRPTLPGSIPIVNGTKFAAFQRCRSNDLSAALHHRVSLPSNIFKGFQRGLHNQRATNVQSACNSTSSFGPMPSSRHHHKVWRFAQL